MQDYTTCKEIKRDSLTINPAKICQPIGAVYAYLGIHGCMPLSHGSQGCCSYLRMVLSRHYREPVLVTTSSFYEGTAVFGGASNLKQAIINTAKMYKPKVIGISTTCVAETIGDDVSAIVGDVKIDNSIDDDIDVLFCNTPSYVGSHITGYANAVLSMVKSFAGKDSISEERINIIPGFIEPADIREIKRLVNLLGVKTNIFPDQSGVLDAPMTENQPRYPAGGAKLESIKASSSAKATFAFGRVAASSAANYLEDRFNVKSFINPTPIGIRNTDQFLMNLKELSDKPIPEEITEERGRLVDMMTDAHPHFHAKKVAVFGDPDVVNGLVSLILEMGMWPRYVLTGTASEIFVKETEELIKEQGLESEVISPGDLFTLHQKIKKESVDLIIGNSYGKLIALYEDIPLIRVGFPITDRANLHHFPIVGYAGAARLVERIGNTLLDRKDRDTDESRLELIM